MNVGWWKLDENKNPVYLGEGVEALKKLDYDNVEGRRVGQDTIGNFKVSTVFLALDHNYSSVGPPILFESMVFGPKDYSDLACVRYATWTEAERGHQILVDGVRKCLAKRPMASARQLERYLSAYQTRAGRLRESGVALRASRKSSASKKKETPANESERSPVDE